MRKRSKLVEPNPEAAQMHGMSISTVLLLVLLLLEIVALGLVVTCLIGARRTYRASLVTKAEAQALADATKEWE